MSTWASVDLPEPLGPMMACTWPLFSFEVEPTQDLGAVDRSMQIANNQVGHVSSQRG